MIHSYLDENYFTFTLHTQFIVDLSEQDKDIFKFRNSQKMTFSAHHEKARMLGVAN